MSTDVIALGPNQTLRVLRSDADALEIEAMWTPGGTPPPPHFHPGQDERFEILEGAMTAVVGDELRVLHAGEVLDIPRGTVHAMWNAGDAAARASWRVTPALRTEEMFRTIASGGVEDFLERFSAEFRLAS